MEDKKGQRTDPANPLEKREFSEASPGELKKEETSGIPVETKSTPEGNFSNTNPDDHKKEETADILDKKADPEGT